MVGWHYQFNGHEFEQTPWDGEGQGSLVCCSSWGHKESDTTEQLKHNNEVKVGESLSDRERNREQSRDCKGLEDLKFLGMFGEFRRVGWKTPRWHSGKESAWQSAWRWNRSRFNPWVKKVPWSRKWQPTAVFLPGKFHRQRSLVGYSPWRLRELDVIKHACMQQHRVGNSNHEKKAINGILSYELWLLSPSKEHREGDYTSYESGDCCPNNRMFTNL